MIDVVTLRKKAVELYKAKRYADAIKIYHALLEQIPGDAGTWLNLGAALRAERHHVAAVGCYRRALDLQPDNAGAWSNMGNAYKDMDRLDDAVLYQSKAVHQEPENRQYRLNYAVALREAKYFDQALVNLNALVEREPHNANYQWERGLVNLYLGNFKQGWLDYESRWRTGDLLVRNFGCPVWGGEDLSNNKLLLVAEQGYGDTILAARFISVIKQRYPACEIALECKFELQPIFSSLPLTQFIDVGTSRYQAGDFDFYCPVMSLMGVLGVNETNIPPPVQVTVPEVSRQKFKAMIGSSKGKFKIGIVWSGSLTFKDNAKRSSTLDKFLSLTELPGVQLYSLQKGDCERDIELLQAAPLIINLGQHLDNFGDTAAAVQELDLIVMTDSSVAHLAGSLNKPVINLLQYKSYWLYFPEKDTTDWYPSMKIIRQDQPGDWDSVFVRLFRLIKKLKDNTL